jgi:hypothetical protein
MKRILSMVLMVVVIVGLYGAVGGFNDAKNWFELFKAIFWLVLFVAAFWALVDDIRKNKWFWERSDD